MTNDEMEMIDEYTRLNGDADDAQERANDAQEDVHNLEDQLNEIEDQWLEGHACSCGLIGIPGCEHGKP